jgi:hypothetical protein
MSVTAVRSFVDRREREVAMTYVLELKVPCKSPCTAFNATESEKRRLNLPLNILLRELQDSGSSGRGRFALGGGFGSFDGPGSDGDSEAGAGRLFVGPGGGGCVSCVSVDMSSEGGSNSELGGKGTWSCGDPAELAVETS